MAVVYIKKLKNSNLTLEVKSFLEGCAYRPARSDIFIKPNICGFYEPTSACIVNPEVVGGVIEYLKEIGFNKITIAELPVVLDTKRVFEMSGYKKLSKKYNVSLLALNSVARKEVCLGQFNVSVPAFIGEAEYINIAKMKTHIQTGVSLCTKNQKGLVASQDRKSMHIKGELEENIKLLARKILPDYCIIDASNALEGDGPGRSGKEILDMNIILAGKNMAAVDRTAALLMGREPGRIKHLEYSGEKIEIIGERVEDLKRDFRIPGEHFQKFNIHFWITDKTCSECSEIMAGLKKSLIPHPFHLLKFLYFALVGRLDILSGGADLPSCHGKVIFIGNCMKEKAAEYKAEFIPGCPPDIKKIIRAIK